MWPFIPTSTQALYTKQILIEANKLQTKYEFLFEPAPGAGGLLSVQKTLKDNKDGQFSLLAHTSAFFIRPVLYPKDQYLDQFKPVMVIAKSNAGLVVNSKQTLDEIVARKKISFGTAGAGSLTHLYAELFVKELKRQGRDVDAVMVHFKSAPEAFVAVTGGHVDATFDFTGNLARTASPLVKVYGVTGREATLAPTLSSLGFQETGSLQNVFAFYAAADTPAAVISEIQELFLKAEKAETVQRLYQIDQATKEQRFTQPGDLSNWYQQMIREFARAGRGVVVTD